MDTFMVLLIKNSPANAGNAGDTGSILGSRRYPGGGHGNPLQYSGLENPMDQRTVLATVRGVAKSWTQLNITDNQKFIPSYPPSFLHDPDFT